MKYPRTPHLPFSLGMTNDDRMIESMDNFFKKDQKLIITEKMDGSNTCLTSKNVFARSHNQNAYHPSFNWIKSQWSQFKFQIPEGQDLFGENCFAIHSIEYEALSSYFYLFGVRNDEKTWLSWEQVQNRAQSFGLETVPVLFEGTLKNEAELKLLANKLMSEPSVFGGSREGFVVRVAQGFADDDFDSMVAKFVRKNHVQTDEHWMNQPVRPQKLRK